MPNHCNNTLGIIGKIKDVQDFIELVTNTEGSDKEEDKYELFKNLIPMPKELEGTTSPSEEGNVDLVDKYGHDNWYDWCNHNWGTKWGDYSLTSTDINIEGEEANIHFYYDTAWAPGCDELANAIVNRFPNLKGFIAYEEPGMGFAGQLIFSKGKIGFHNQWELNQAYDDVTDIDFD